MNKITLFSPDHNGLSQLSVVLEILKTENCRANEVLSAKWSNFFPGQFLVLEGSKKSANVIVRDRFILQMIEQLPKIHSTKIFPSLTYSKLYHHVKRHYSHLFYKFKGRKNYKVTHGFRYSAVESVVNEQIIRDILHHRSAKSGKYYKLQKGGSNVFSKKT